MLSGSLTASTTFPKEDHRSGWLKGEKFVLNHPRIDKVIFGVKNMNHVNELLES